MFTTIYPCLRCLFRWCLLQRMGEASCGWLNFWIVLLSFVINWKISCAYVPHAIPQTNGKIWPRPQFLNASQNVLQITNHFRWKLDQRLLDFSNNGKDCQIITQSFSRHHKIIHNQANGIMHYPSYPVLDRLVVSINQGCNASYPHSKMDESYYLSVQFPIAVLYSQEVWGALRGIETFSQLFYTDENQVLLMINETEVYDYPFYAHRGFLIDTSRHYLPMQIILRHLDAMEAVKLNILHWHITDDQSFPFQSVTYPRLSDFGAFHKSTHIYTHKDIRAVIEEARLRGIRIVPELDIPAHTRSWAKGYPSLFNQCSNWLWHEGKGPLLDASKNSTFTFLANLIKELADVFVDEILYLGGDEFSDRCWTENEKRWTTDKRSEVVLFFDRIGEIVSKLSQKRKIMFWQEVLEMGASVPQQSIINIWKNVNLVAHKLPEVVQNESISIVLSTPWYINYISYGEIWRKYYDVDISMFFASVEKFVFDSLVGGEVCLWGEFVDATNFLQTAWPGAAAPAERLWTRPEITELSQFGDTQARLNELRCRLILRKIPAQPIQASFCRVEWNY